MKVEQNVLQVLSNSTIAGNALTLPAQLDRLLYQRTNKVLEAAGGRWNRKAQAHIFGTNAGEAVEQIILTGQVSSPRDLDFFATPAEVVERLMALAQVEPGMQTLEPSAGEGAIAQALAAATKVDCVELDAKRADVLRAGGYARQVQQTDFLGVTPAPIYHRIVMNPPFKHQADIHHVLHALSFLAQGGVLVSVMSASVTFRGNTLTEDFRALVERRGGFTEPLPENTFKESGTQVRTVVAVVPSIR